MLRFILRVVLPAALAFAPLAPAAAQEIRPDYAIATDPVLEAPPPVPADTSRLTDLWLLALARPESEMQRQAAEAIFRAQQDGIGGLEKSCPALLKIVAAESSHPAARYAAAQALVALDHKAGTAALRTAAEQNGSLVRQVVEPALARWSDQPIRATWLARLKDAHSQRRDLLLALAGLGTVRDESAAPYCLALATDTHRSADVRLAAARAAGSIADTGWEEQAERWSSAAKAPLMDRLCAAALLARHRSAKAQEILARLAKDAEPAVASAALAQLHASDVELVLPLAEEAMRNADANVRREGASAYVLRPTPERVKSLARLLDDPHPALRGQVRDDLFRLAQTAELGESVRAAATEMLAGESWRGQEQAALLLA
ncbi:MAG: hypothetical protein WEH44_01180, partial [Pirellulaceae bacterium]